jgi:hypothetical protein
MAVKTVGYLANTVANTERGPSEVVWQTGNTGNAWIEDFMQDPRLGVYTWDEFDSSGVGNLALLGVGQALSFTNLGRWSLLVPAGGGVVDAGIIGGAIQLTPGSLAIASTNQTTAFLTSNFGCYQLITNSSGASALQGRLAFEARIALTSVTNGKRDVFVGLCDPLASSTVTTQALYPFTQGGSSSNNLNSTITTNGLIGFYFPSASATGLPSGDCAFVYGLSNLAKVVGSNLKGLISNVTGSAIAAGTYYKLGFVYDPIAPPTQISSASDGQTAGNVAKAMITIYVNGLKAAAFLTQTQNILTASFPTGVMTPLVALSPTSSGTGNTATNQAGLLNLDWIRVAQNMLA